MEGPSLIPKNPLVHVEAPPKKRHPVLVSFVVTTTVLIVIGIVGGFFALVYPSTSQQLGKWITLRNLPLEIKSAVYIHDDEKEGSAEYRPNGEIYSYRKVEGYLVSADNRNAPAQILRTNAGEYAITASGKLLLQSSIPKAGVSRSADGRYVAYAHEIATSSELASGEIDTAKWMTTLLDSTTGSSTDIGIGISPLFVDATHVVRIATTSVIETNIQTGRHTTLVDGGFGTTTAGVLASPNRTLLGWHDHVTSSVKVYKVFGDGIGLFSTVPIERNDASTYALGDTALYEIRPSGDSAALYMTPFGGVTKLVMYLPPSVAPNRILIG
ncbi:hypothetical protein K2Q08_03160, partial [Patescibacteria group bacterium]|nr:hypothetical protein [Patescibacteria group bacterium]